ncbi:MAG TPA: class I SAM-dependent methyltransferase [Candidatus Paceibacterota bacterium]|nr:class I SAM-dependent methyltransferase [Candidatus Paceibacterota bacterium]
MHTTQKEILFREISAFLDKHQIQSLLDIGAGDGSVALKISEKVSDYLAIEKRPSNVALLKDLGLKVKNATFPFPLQQTFDLVLSSHSVPEEKSLYPTFLPAAWKAVKPGGFLIIITFKGGSSETVKIKNTWLKKPQDLHDEELFTEMMGILKNFGEINIRRFESTFESESLAETTEFVSLSFDEENNDKRKQFLKKILQEKYFKDGAYHLPAEHVMVTVAKQN